jgi:hypothetical protein
MGIQKQTLSGKIIMPDDVQRIRRKPLRTEKSIIKTTRASKQL